MAAAAHAQIADPGDVSGLVLWLDGQDVNGTGSQPADGSAVAIWADKSGQGNDANTVAGTVTFEATGFDGVNPGLRFPSASRMTGPNVFPANYHNEMTIFFVNSNVTITPNFSVSFNGTNTSSNIADGRFSFHTPWVNSRIYFDAGACCGATRLQGPSPNGLTETTLHTAMNDEPGAQQLLRIDGALLDQDNTGHNASVFRGLLLGSLSGARPFDGRFAEMVVYNRALSIAEIEDVECYLLAKWKPSAAAAGCVPQLDVSKSSSAVNATGLGAFFLPGNDALYEITVEKPASAATSDTSIFLVDTLPDEVTFFNGDIDGAGPLTGAFEFTQSGAGLSFDPASDVGFSDNVAAPTDYSQCNYTPAAGYDPAIRHVCIRPQGAMPGSASTISFTVAFRARVD